MHTQCNLWIVLLLLLTAAAPVLSQQPASAAALPQHLRLNAALSTQSAEVLLDPAAPAWQSAPAQRIALNRTPPLYATEPPASLEISFVEVRTLRAAGNLFVRMSWRDASADRSELPAMPDTPPEQRFLKEHTLATDRFFDAAAVMFPKDAPGGVVSPSLQMGDAQDPVSIYYWNAVRGAMRMEAAGRGTTRRTGESFPARAVYSSGEWQVVMELPALPPMTPLAFAIWNGSQLDRDGRKYFSVWHWLE
jgi:complex iron-sulfur molybdoenzyme family reductase subunit gamma